MMKLLLLAVVIGVALFLFKSRLRGGDRGGDAAARKPKSNPKTAPKTPAAPTPMLACAHCGLHLPQSDAVSDASGRAYCTEAHRIAGPR